jgi:hypothetical protein
MGRISIYVATLKQHLHKEYIYITWSFDTIFYNLGFLSDFFDRKGCW